MAEPTQKPANVPEPPSEIRRVKTPRHDAFSNLEDEPGYAEFELDETFGDPNKMTTGMRVMFTLLMIGVTGMVLYLVLLILYPDQFSSKDWIGANGDKKIYASAEARAWALGFELGGIKLGMSAAETKHIYPSLRLEPGAGGGQKGFFAHHDGEYQVSFKSLEQGARAYLVQSKHVFPKVSYLNLLSELSGRYGQPTGSESIAAEIEISIQCNLFWKITGVRLTAEIKTSASKSGGDAQTLLRVTATDIRPDSFFKKPRKKKGTLNLRDLNFQK